MVPLCKTWLRMGSRDLDVVKNEILAGDAKSGGIPTYFMQAGMCAGVVVRILPPRLSHVRCPTCPNGTVGGRPGGRPLAEPQELRAFGALRVGRCGVPSVPHRAMRDTRRARRSARAALHVT